MSFYSVPLEILYTICNRPKGSSALFNRLHPAHPGPDKIFHNERGLEKITETKTRQGQQLRGRRFTQF